MQTKIFRFLTEKFLTRNVGIESTDDKSVCRGKVKPNTYLSKVVLNAENTKPQRFVFVYFFLDLRNYRVTINAIIDNKYIGTVII